MPESDGFHKQGKKKLGKGCQRFETLKKGLQFSKVGKVDKVQNGAGAWEGREFTFSADLRIRLIPGQPGSPSRYPIPDTKLLTQHERYGKQ
jgi:hypothetical protein